MNIKKMKSDFWQALEKSLKKITKGLVWFCLTFFIALIPAGIYWLVEASHGVYHTFTDIMLRGDILAVSIVLLSSLVWDYVIFEKKDEVNFLENSIFYGVPLVTIPFSATAYSFCQAPNPLQPEMIMVFQFWILALTAVYAVLIKLSALEQTCSNHN